MLILLAWTDVPVQAQDGAAPDGAGKATVTAKDLAGEWTPAQSYFRQQLVVRVRPNGVRVALRSTSGGSPRPFGTLRVEGDSVFVQSAAEASIGFFGRVGDSRDTLAGTWQTTENAANVTFVRVSSADTPSPGEGRDEGDQESRDDVSFRGNGDVQLRGTFARPSGAGPFPGVVLLQGSQARTRDYRIAGHDLFEALADSLVQRGFAVLRYDKRGTGASGGDRMQVSLEADVEDAAHALQWLRGRPEVTPSRTGFVGNSLGTLIATRASNSEVLDAAPSGLALLMPMAEPIGSVFLWQNRQRFRENGRTPAAVDSLTNALEQAHAALRRPTDSLTAAQAVRPFANTLSPDNPDRFIWAHTVPLFRELLRADPIASARTAPSPMLAIFGENDQGLPPDRHAQPFDSLIANRSDGSAVHRVAGVNHWMQPANNGSIAAAQAVGPVIDSTVVDLVTTWLRQLET